jgi:phosphate transport system protein
MTNGHHSLRQVFHEGLAFLTDEMTEMSRLVEQALADATTALLEADLSLAEQVISGDDQIDQIYRENEEMSVDLIARQQPVASDLRVVITSLRSVVSLERMGDLAVHVADVARRRYPEHAVPDDLKDTFEDMSTTARRMVALCRKMIQTGEADRVTEVRALDDVLDAHHRRMFSIILDANKYDTATAVDVVMLSRFYERYADHAVSFANRLHYLYTGELTSAKD